MDKNQFIKLIQEDENSTLDFKRDIYTFTQGAPRNIRKTETGKFIKDLLSLYNTVRNGAAYIIMGIEEDENLNKNFIGISSKIDGAILQDKVKDKLKPIVDFSLSYVEYEQKEYGIITIPLPQFSIPSVAIDKYGSVEKDVVYIRRDSMNADAKHEDIQRIYKWLKELEGLRTKQKISKKEFIKFIRTSLKSNEIFEKAEPIIWEKANIIGLSNEEVELIITKEEKRKKRFDWYFEDPSLATIFIIIFLMGLIGIGVFVIQNIKSNQQNNRVVKMISKNQFAEAKDDLLLNENIGQSGLTRKVLEKEIKYFLSKDSFQLAVLALNEYQLVDVKIQYADAGSEDAKSKVIKEYNQNVRWINKMGKLIFNHAAIKGEKHICKNICGLIIQPQIKIKNRKLEYDYETQNIIKSHLKNIE